MVVGQKYVPKITQNGHPGKWKHGLNLWCRGGFISTHRQMDADWIALFSLRLRSPRLCDRLAHISIAPASFCILLSLGTYARADPIDPGKK